MDSLRSLFDVINKRCSFLCCHGDAGTQRSATDISRSSLPVSDAARMNDIQIFTVRRYAMAGISCRHMSVCLCVCYTPVLYQNGFTDRADFPPLMLRCVLGKLGYLQNKGTSRWNCCS